MKESLAQMESLDIFVPVMEPTPWVSNILVVEKNNAAGDLCICLDLVNIIIPKYYILATEEMLLS